MANTFTRLSEHHEASLEQHEKLVKDAHDHLSEASEKFKAALDQQVHVMVMHNDRHEMMKEGAEKLAIEARKEFRNLSHSFVGNSDNTKNTNVNVLKDKLREANAQVRINENLWDGQRSDFEKRTKQLEEEKKKLLDQACAPLPFLAIVC